MLIDGLRADQLGILPGRHHNAKVIALERLAAQPLGADWFAWLRWYEGTRLRPPPGYHAFKARLLGRIDPALARPFASPGAEALRIEEIVWGGTRPEPEGAAREAAAVAADGAGLAANDAVVGVVLAGEARAYPLRWLDWHEVASDRLGGRDIAVVWCGLAASAMAFDRAPGSGEPLRLAPSGLVQRSVRLMVDGASGTLWNELTGRAASGASPGLRLDPLPAVLTTWAAWRARHPATTALAGEVPGPALTPYARYHTTQEAVFPVAAARSELAAKAQVYGIERGLRARAWPLDALLEARVVNGEVGGHAVAIVAARGRIELEGEHPRHGRLRFSPGAEVRAYARERELEFAPGPGPDDVVDGRGRPWRVTDEALEGPDGARAPRVPGTVAYWFAWQAFHPKTEVVD